MLLDAMDDYDPARQDVLCNALEWHLSLVPRKVLAQQLEQVADPVSWLFDKTPMQAQKQPPYTRRIPWVQAPVSRLNIFDPRFPDPLRHIPDPPLLLYCVGDCSILRQGLLVAVVGARRCSEYGRQVAQSVARGLAQFNIPLVSGLAYGIDGRAHEATAAAGGLGVGVLGGGVDVIYPRRHAGLAGQLVTGGGLVLSEYAPAVAPRPYHFLERNRLISGLSKLVVVVEAGKRSGSLNTARTALEQGRDVWAVPGQLTSSLSEGCHVLVQQGAGLYTDMEDLLFALGVASRDPVSEASAGPGKFAEASELHRAIRQLVREHPKTLEELDVLLGAYPMDEIMQVVAELELSGVVEASTVGYIAAL